MNTATPEGGSKIATIPIGLQTSTRGQSPPPRPITPLRPASRTSLRSSHTPTHGPSALYASSLASLEPAFAELSDSMADLEANFVHLQLMHESLSRFTECFASFLYGLNVNAFCVDFPEAPVQESFGKAADGSSDTKEQFRQPGDQGRTLDQSHYNEVDNSLASDNSYVGLFSASAAIPPRDSTTALRTPTRAGPTRGGRTVGRQPSSTSRGSLSGLARATTRGRGSTVR